MAFNQQSVQPAHFREAKKVWESEIEPETEENPFPTHPDHAWRFAGFHDMGDRLQHYVLNEDNLKDFAEQETRDKVQKAGKTLGNMATTKAGLLRFWLLQAGVKATDGVEAKGELWVLRLSNNTHGTSLRQALNLLDSLDLIDRALMGAQLRADRAPKSGIQRTLENSLDGLKQN